jgi:hypothetical protein
MLIPDRSDEPTTVKLPSINTLPAVSIVNRLLIFVASVLEGFND